MQYNPVIRNFCRLRRVLVETLGVPRSAVRPSAKLADLIPRSERRRVWAALCGENFNALELRMSNTQMGSCLGVTLAWMLGGCLFWADGWYLFLCSGLLLGLLIASVLFCGFANHIPCWLTVGDMVLAATSGSDCRKAGYRLTRNEIFLKLRYCIATRLNINAVEITPHGSLSDFVDC